MYTYPKRDFPEILFKIFESVKTGIEIARKTSNISICRTEIDLVNNNMVSRFPDRFLHGFDIRASPVFHSTMTETA